VELLVKVIIMAYSDTVNMVTGDSLPELNFTLKDSSTAATGKRLDEYDDSTWAPLALDGANVNLRVRKQGSTSVDKTIACSITDETLGKVKASFANSPFSDPGTYEAELEITFSGGGVQTVNDLIKIKVRSDFD
jgi:hypothetical protein